MALVTETLFGTVDKIQTAIDRIRQFEPPEGYYVAFSGGKDSQTVYHLCKEAGVKFDAHYNLTTVDPPELVYFIKKNYPDVIIDRPKKTMWQLIIENGIPPTRIQKYCCRILKERGGEGRFKITGIRALESQRRKNKRQLTEICFKTATRTLNPIIDWTEEDVWQYLNMRKIKSCLLYQEGFKRLGCIGCPENILRNWQFKKWPKYYLNYLRVFEKMLALRKEKGLETTWKTAEDVMNWWIYEMPKENPDQLSLLEQEVTL